MGLYGKFIGWLIIVVVLLSFMRVVVSNRISTSGVVLGKLNDQVQNLKIENDLLEEKLLTMSSLTNIASEAAKLGFSEKTDSLVLSNNLPIAQR